VSRLLDVQCGGQAFCETFEGHGAVAQLRSLVVHTHAHDRPEPLDDARSLSRPERRRRRRVEAHLGPRVRTVGVLSSGTAAGREPPVELVERYLQVAVHSKTVVHRCLGSHGD
jgi:hypothetical protein